MLDVRACVFWQRSLIRGLRVFGVLIALLGASPSLAGARMATPIFDAHSHYTASDAEVFAPAQIIASMDAAGVRRIVVAGEPPGLAQVLYRVAPERVIPLLGVYASRFDRVAWMHDTSLPDRVAAALAEGNWAGIGELHLFSRDRASPVFERLVRLAAAYDLVLLIHGDAEVIDRVFELAPGARVLWAHLGTFPVPDLLDAMLERYGEQLWIDTSVRDERIAPQTTLLPEWRELFERHPRRFVVAVDAFSVNRWRGYAEVVASIRAWTDDLPEPLRGNLLHDNAARLFAHFPAPGLPSAP